MDHRVYIGIDIGGTKIAAGLVNSSGRILARQKVPSPAAAPQEQVVETVMTIMKRLMAGKGGVERSLGGVGIGVPGIVDPSGTKVLVTPNMGLSGSRLVDGLKKKISVPVVMGNDANLGILGEKVFGAARNAQTVVGLFLGTGVGGGVIIDGKLFCGSSGKGAEIGHMVIDPSGPACTCGNKGCLEAYVGRWAIERDIRAAVQRGEKTLLEVGRGKKIKSGALAVALAHNDCLVKKIMTRVSHILGKACVSLRHIFDPELIILGGGVIEACGAFIVPKVRAVCARDQFYRRFGAFPVVAAQREDDAVMLGAVALVRSLDQSSHDANGRYPHIEAPGQGKVLIDRKSYEKDVYIRSNGKIKNRDKKEIKQLYGTSHAIGPRELKKICKKKPSILVVASGYDGSARLTPQARKYLKGKNISCRVLPTPQAALFYNSLPGKKAILIHVTC